MKIVCFKKPVAEEYVEYNVILVKMCIGICIYRTEGKTTRMYTGCEQCWSRDDRTGKHGFKLFCLSVFSIFCNVHTSIFIIDGCFKNLLLKKTGKFSSWLWMRKGCGGRWGKARDEVLWRSPRYRLLIAPRLIINIQDEKILIFELTVFKINLSTCMILEVYFPNYVLNW